MSQRDLDYVLAAATVVALFLAFLGISARRPSTPSGPKSSWFGMGRPNIPRITDWRTYGEWGDVYGKRYYPMIWMLLLDMIPAFESRRHDLLSYLWQPCSHHQLSKDCRWSSRQAWCHLFFQTGTDNDKGSVSSLLHYLRLRFVQYITLGWVGVGLWLEWNMDLLGENTGVSLKNISAHGWYPFINRSKWKEFGLFFKISIAHQKILRNTCTGTVSVNQRVIFIRWIINFLCYRSAAALVMNISYGHDVTEDDDVYVTLVEKGMKTLGYAGVYGTYVVDYLPFCESSPYLSFENIYIMNRKTQWNIFPLGSQGRNSKGKLMNGASCRKRCLRSLSKWSNRKQ